MARTAAVADQASVRGEKQREPFGDETRQVEGAPLARLGTLGLDPGEQPLHRAGRRGAERLVEVDGLAQLFAHQLELAGEILILLESRFHALRVAAAERAGGVPRQQGFDVQALGFILRDHGQPLSTPAALSSSESRLRA